jgi:predicted nucleic acid-binding protein
MVAIILDTNIWINFVAKDNPSELLEQLIAKRDSKEIILLSNKIILDEWLRNKEQTVKDVSNTIKGNYSSAKKLADYLSLAEKQQFLLTVNPYFNQEQQRIDLAVQRVEQTEALLRSCVMTPITAEMKLQVVDWALGKRAPFKKKSNSVGDALILLSSVEYWKKETIGITDAIFVSFNHEDYTDGKKIDDIHEDLKEIVQGANMLFTRNIGEALHLAPQLTNEIGDYIDYQVDSWIEWQVEIARGK